MKFKKFYNRIKRTHNSIVKSVVLINHLLLHNKLPQYLIAWNNNHLSSQFQKIINLWLSWVLWPKISHRSILYEHLIVGRPTYNVLGRIQFLPGCWSQYLSSSVLPSLFRFLAIRALPPQGSLPHGSWLLQSE